MEDGFVSVSVPKGIKPRVITVEGPMDAEAEAAERLSKASLEDKKPGHKDEFPM